MSDDRLRAIVPVRCGQCLARYGKAAMLGEMQLWPDHIEGGGWRWQRVDRLKIYPDGRRERRIAGQPQRGGGAEARCGRCGHRPRFRIATLARQAAEIVEGENVAGVADEGLLNVSASRRGITL
ncbi:hypothetical protein [Georgenia satyanarayanai]|uniref:hypothetical protein n=1 Tax=Georgenia satyanarayanai TaxID=860221 RepID=UPI000DA15111|nr:hypothetical protein [Georgenia satyanarayanai]